MTLQPWIKPLVPIGAERRRATGPAISAPAVFQEAERQLTVAAAPAIAKRPARVPANALVPLQRAMPPSRLALAPPRPIDSANDNAAKPASDRSVLREILFLGILVASLYGAFLAGRNSGVQRIIVVPGPTSFYSVVT